jgi:hypothetical protein
VRVFRLYVAAILFLAIGNLIFYLQVAGLYFSSLGIGIYDTPSNRSYDF